MANMYYISFLRPIIIRYYGYCQTQWSAYSKWVVRLVWIRNDPHIKRVAVYQMSQGRIRYDGLKSIMKIRRKDTLTLLVETLELYLLVVGEADGSELSVHLISVDATQ